METKYAIEKTFKCKSLGISGALYDSKEKVDKICQALNEAKTRFSKFLNYKVIKVNV